MSEKLSNFQKLNKIPVGEFTHKKGQFSYLSWATAWKILKTYHPNAEVGINKYNDLPFIKTDCGYFIEAYCTIDGITETELFPVMNNYNKPILNPNAMDINKSIKRAMTKAIALHGLGLHVYEGEDIPSDVMETENAREQLRELLKMHNKLDKKAEEFLLNLKYEEIIKKINEYSTKENK